MIVQYHDQKFLSSIGYAFDPSTLTDFELSCLRIIHLEVMKLNKAAARNRGDGDG